MPNEHREHVNRSATKQRRNDPRSTEQDAEEKMRRAAWRKLTELTIASSHDVERTEELRKRSDNVGQFAFCEVKSPASGRWTIVVARKLGEGDVQISASFATHAGQ